MFLGFFVLGGKVGSCLVCFGIRGIGFFYGNFGVGGSGFWIWFKRLGKVKDRGSRF